MPTTTVFLALQCCQCSTMQVKQQKKSSNKWTCVVCNQKQSVLKVFAQGFMAKDVRKFVQSFNMSRQLAEQNYFSAGEQIETLEIEDQISCNRKQKRTDWTEYIDPDEEEEEDSKTINIDENPADKFGLKIVTEMPKPVFKKPKLKTYGVAKHCEYGDEKKSMVDFGERLVRTKSKSQAGESSRYSGEMVGGAQQQRSGYEAEMKANFADTQEGMKLEQPMSGMSKWKDFLIEDDSVNFAEEVPWRNELATVKKGKFSKWSCYVAEEDDDFLLASGKNLKCQANQWNDQNAFETELVDQRVEEDIHPDFL